MISLFVVVLPAIGTHRGSDPWVELTGGPGNAATDYARDYATDYRYLRQNRDVLLVDQRGTGRSSPLYCEELSLHRVSSFFPRWPANAVRTCRQRLSATADLWQYSSSNAARDLDAVRRWLGYSKLNLFSYSYGSRLALEYMRKYPAQVRSAILWGVVPPDFMRPLYYARDGQLAFDRLVADCLAESKCRAAYPRTAEELKAVMDRLSAAPIAITIRHPSTGMPLSTQITSAGLAQAIWVALTRPDQARQLPMAIHAAAQGNFEPFISLDVAREPPRRRYYNAMHLSVVCPEETSYVDRSGVDRLYRKTFMPPDRAYEYLDACRIWGLARVPKSDLRPIKASIPALIVSGYMDPITPPEWGDKVHRTLPKSRHIIIQQLSHESNGLGGAECLDRLFADYLDYPRPESLDIDCLKRITAPPFAEPAAPPG